MGKLEQMPPKAGLSLPTAQQITDDLGTILTQIMLFFKQNRIPGWYINSVGSILAQLKFDAKEKQTPAQIQFMVQQVAEKQLELMKVDLLKASIEQTSLVN
jgi:hypothetical protein